MSHITTGLVYTGAKGGELAYSKLIISKLPTWIVEKGVNGSWCFHGSRISIKNSYQMVGIAIKSIHIYIPNLRQLKL